MTIERRLVLRVKLAARPLLPTLWYENEAGERWPVDLSDPTASPPEGFVYQWSRFPYVLRETRLRTVEQKDVDACDHPANMMKPDLGLIEGLEGRECMKCHGTQTKDAGAPWPEKWEAHGSREVMSGESTWPDDLVLAMVRPSPAEMFLALERHGEEPRLLGMNDAIILAATSCERCLNALLWRYGLDDGYPPYSTQWNEASTKCHLCETPGVWDWLLNEKPVKTAASERTRADLKSGEHYTELCRQCGTVISQCRCASPNKVTLYGLCDACAGIPPEPEPTVTWHRVAAITTRQQLEDAGRDADPAMLAEVHERSRKWSEAIMQEVQGESRTASLVTPNQLKYIRTLLKQRGVTEPPGLDKWTALNASKLIGGLQDRRLTPTFDQSGKFRGWETKKATLALSVVARYQEALTPRQKGWEKRKEKDDFAEQNIPPEHLLLWRKIKNRFKGTPDQRAEQFMEYLEAHPEESDDVLQERADRDVAKLRREQEKERREQVKVEKDCEKNQTKYEDAWYKEQERQTREKNIIKQLKEKAEDVCQSCPTCHQYGPDEERKMIPFAASLAARVAARYKQKKKVESEDGGETTVYVYSEGQIARRNAEKAKRLEGLRKSIGNLRSKVKRDLKSSDPEKALTALAVALIDHTYERVGNDTSAKEKGHVGVTGWQKSHISFGRGKATVKYTGKSGVEQKKVVSDKAVLTALRNAYEACGDDDGCLFEYATGKVGADKVNAYLEAFDVSAKDLRGFHANREMQERLGAIRAKGGKLSEDKKERQAKLKEEFKKALEQTAEAVGHEASTLKSQYLVPGLEEEYLTQGKVTPSLKKSSFSLAARIVQRYLEGDDA
jgi:hypothetical protein